MTDLPQTPSTEAKVDNFTPSTAHGRALLDWPQNFGYHHPDCEVTAEDDCTCDLADLIIAIEKQAATEERERIERPWREALLRIRHLAAQRAHLDSTLGDIFDVATRSLLNSDTEGQLEEGGR